MKNGSAILLAIVLLAIAGTIWQRYDQYVLRGNFLIEANAACDPESEECFVMDCDPETDEECDVTPYKKVEIAAHDAPKCLEEHTCEAFLCADDSESCSITYCSEETLDEGEACLVPEEATPDVDTEESEPAATSTEESGV